MRLVQARQKGFSLLELFLVIVLVSILTAIAVPNIIAASRATYETRAIANIKTLSQHQQAFYSIHNKFAVINELFGQNYISNKQFTRASSDKEDSTKLLSTEVISDGYYDYSFRYSANADGYTLDADPKKALANKYRFFRYRSNRLTQNKVSGSVDIIFFALPRQDSSSPANTAYKPLN